MVPRRGKHAFLSKIDDDNKEFKKKMEINEYNEYNAIDPIPIYDIGKNDPPMFSFPRQERFKDTYFS
jgi:hypothetical protein